MVEKLEFEVDSEQIKNRIDFAFYSNVLQVSRSEYDFHIDFSQYPPDDDNNASSVRIYMPHKLAKELLGILGEVIADLNTIEEE